MYKEFLQKNSIFSAIMLTIAGYLALRLGGISAGGLSPNVAEVVSYIIPLGFLLLIKIGFKIYEGDNLTKVYDPNNKKSVLRLVLTVFIGLLSLFIPLFFTITGDVLTLINKPMVKDAAIILAQLIALNICIGLFEEGLFRNIIMNVLMVDDKKSTYIRAFFVSSILFGLIHISNLTIASNRPIAITSQVIYAIFSGMLMAGLYLKYRSFFGLVLLHGTIDFVSMISKLYGQNTDIATVNLPDITISQGITSVATMLPTAIIGLLLLRSFLKKNIKTS